MFGYISERQHKAEVKKLYNEIARTGLLLAGVRQQLEIAEGVAGKLAVAQQQAAKVPHLEAENHQLAAELARLTTRGPGGRFVKVDAPKPNGTAAAVQGVSHQPV